MTDLPTFRVHFADGSCCDVIAATPEDARKRAEKAQPGIQVLKTKRLREKQGA